MPALLTSDEATLGHRLCVGFSFSQACNKRRSILDPALDCFARFPICSDYLSRGLSAMVATPSMEGALPDIPNIDKKNNIELACS